jgi:hypothetical protein
MTKDTRALGDTVTAYFSGSMSVENAAQRIIDLGFGEGFKIGGDSPADLEYFQRLGSSALLDEVARRLARRS